VVRQFFIDRDHDPTVFTKYYIWQAYLYLIPLGFAATASQLLTDIAKYSTGRLRPHFIDLCRPELRTTGQVINRFSICQNPYEYVLEYKCANILVGDRYLKDARLSFMSGHSSFVAACFVYLIVSTNPRI